MHNRTAGGDAATALQRSRSSNSVEFVIAVCVLAAALLLAAVERSGAVQPHSDLASGSGLVSDVPSASSEAETLPSDAIPASDDFAPSADSPADVSSADSRTDVSGVGSPSDVSPTGDSVTTDFGVEEDLTDAGDPDLAASASQTGVAASDTPAPGSDRAPDAAPAELALAQEALGRIGYPWQHLGYGITFHGRDERVRALTFPYESRIEVYVRPGDTVEGLAHVIAHEIGHAIDVELNDGDRRRSWLVDRGVSEDYPWWPGNGLNDFAVGAGDFAECFAAWDVGAESLSELPGDCRDSFELLEELIEP